MTAIENSPSVDALLFAAAIIFDGHLYRENSVMFHPKSDGYPVDIRRILNLCSARATGINFIPPTAKTQ
ncbi:hypothetical protein [Corynebacterium kroppenstedtii]|uniref:hypothetical protein n=1 Tax=Corynebacterium kroppenstedtii TaxID=161879 RepID=UPI002656BA38|nr:hypothetical protein [Corynebacterium kroppenstedtii]MDN8623901.1 hypothetical protein [Corynebacterium kroppenstedtii]